MSDLNKMRNELAEEFNENVLQNTTYYRSDVTSGFKAGFDTAIEHTRKEAKPTKVALDEKGYSSLFKQLTNEKQTQAANLLLTALKFYAEGPENVKSELHDDYRYGGKRARAALAEYAKLMGGCE